MLRALVAPTVFRVSMLLLGSALLQAQTHNSLPDGVVTDLHELKYPQMARIAQVTGDVQLAIRVRPDGSVAYADVLAGAPLLKDAALASAENSKFLCEGCMTTQREFQITYTFRLREDIDCSFKHLRGPRCLYLWRCGTWTKRTRPPRQPEVTRMRGHVTLYADSVCIDTQASSTPGL